VHCDDALLASLVFLSNGKIIAYSPIHSPPLWGNPKNKSVKHVISLFLRERANPIAHAKIAVSTDRTVA